MNVVGPLFAAGADWLDFVLPILVAIFWVVGQILNLIRRPAGAGCRPPAAPPRPPRRPVAGEPPADVRVQLERQIEEFLRQSRGEPQQPAPRPTPPPAAPRRDRSQAAGKKPAKPPAGAAAKSAKPAPRLTDRQFVPLGDAGDDVVEHVQEAFANDLGHRDPMLAPPPAAKTAGADAISADFAKAVRDPAALRRLIVMREILDRPVDRWK